MNKDKWTVNGEDEGEDPVFKHDDAIERYLENPDAIIADFTGHRFILKVEPGCITGDSITDIENMIRDTAIDYEYPLHGIDITNDRIEIKVEVSVNEAPLESAERFQNRLEQAGVETELSYIGTLSKK